MRLVSFLILTLLTTFIHCEDFPQTFIDLSPELSWGVMDNGPAWIQICPMKGNFQITPDTALKGGFSYAFEIPRSQKPLGGINHHGFRIDAELEQRITKDIRFFYEINIGGKVDGAVQNIPYLSDYNYQRFGIRWTLRKVVFQ